MDRATRAAEIGKNTEEKLGLPYIRSAGVAKLMSSTSSINTVPTASPNRQLTRTSIRCCLQRTPRGSQFQVRDFNLCRRRRRAVFQVLEQYPWRSDMTERKLQNRRHPASSSCGRLQPGRAPTARMSSVASCLPAHHRPAEWPSTGSLVGRDAELRPRPMSWSNEKTSILSLVAEGGAGKSALVNEWLTRLQADSYRGAYCALGWSVLQPGLKERARLPRTSF